MVGGTRLTYRVRSGRAENDRSAENSLAAVTSSPNSQAYTSRHMNTPKFSFAVFACGLGSFVVIALCGFAFGSPAAYLGAAGTALYALVVAALTHGLKDQDSPPPEPPAAEDPATTDGRSWWRGRFGRGS